MKWKADNCAGLAWRLNQDRTLYVEKHDADWVWFVVDEAKRQHEAEGYARNKAEAQRCAVAVATAMGWVKP